jgi:hypothetical protein
MTAKIPLLAGSRTEGDLQNVRSQFEDSDSYHLRARRGCRHTLNRLSQYRRSEPFGGYANSMSQGFNALLP